MLFTGDHKGNKCYRIGLYYLVIENAVYTGCISNQIHTTYKEGYVHDRENAGITILS